MSDFRKINFKFEMKFPNIAQHLKTYLKQIVSFKGKLKFPLYFPVQLDIKLHQLKYHWKNGKSFVVVRKLEENPRKTFAVKDNKNISSGSSDSVGRKKL